LGDELSDWLAFHRPPQEQRNKAVSFNHHEAAGFCIVFVPIAKFYYMQLRRRSRLDWLACKYARWGGAISTILIDFLKYE
jgi:hypothetical protein